MGSGAGILAIPLAILQLADKVFSVDRSAKKIQFQRHVKRSLGLERLALIQADIEKIEPLDVDILLAKAFGPLEEILKKGGGHLKEEGLAFVVKGKNEEARELAGFFCIKRETYRLPGLLKEYQLFVYKKI